MVRPKSPCGSEAAYRRHLREGEPVDDACRRAASGAKAGRAVAGLARSGEAVQVAYESLPADEDVSPLEEAMDNLRIVRAALRSGPPHNTIAALTKRRDELVDRIRSIKSEKGEVSVLDQLAQRRAERQSAATG